MGDITQRWSLDTWVEKNRPDRNFEETLLLRLRDDPDTQGDTPSCLGFLYFNRAAPLGSTILSATLRLRTHADATTKDVTVRAIPVTERVFLSSMTWNTLPSVDTSYSEGVGAAFHTKTGPWDWGAVWELDVTEHMQSVSDGAEWMGWRLSAYAPGEGVWMDNRLYVYGSNGYERDLDRDWRPELHVVWSDAPDTPTQLHPGQGLAVRTAKPWLRWDYTDVAGNQQMAALQVQWDDSTDFLTPVWDSGTYPASLPELDMGMDMAAEGLPAFAGIPDGGGLYWRVRVQDGAGLWSDWSDAVFTRYSSGGTLTLLAPSVGTYDEPAGIDNSTPIVSWSLTGATQEAHRVRVWVGDDEHTIFDTGRTTGTRTSLEVAPDAFLRARTDLLYRVLVEVWDDEARTDVPNATAVYREQTYAMLDWDAATSPVDTISAWPLDPYPMVEVQWTRDPAAEGWVIVRDGTVLAELDYADTVLPDGSHRWVDRYAPPRRELRYEVHAVVDGKTAKGAIPAFVVSEPYGIWLVNESDSVCIVGTEDGTWGMGEMSEAHEPISGDRVVQTRTGLRGFEGSVSGLLIGEVMGLEGISARYWRDAFLRIKRGRSPWLVAQTLSLPVIIADAAPSPTPDVEEQYAVEFSFWQRGPYDWGEL